MRGFTARMLLKVANFYRLPQHILLTVLATAAAVVAYLFYLI